MKRAFGECHKITLTTILRYCLLYNCYEQSYIALKVELIKPDAPVIKCYITRGRTILMT